MESKTHIIISLAVVGILYYLNSFYQWVQIPADNILYIQLIIITLIYANIPDIDQPGSRINKYITTILIGIILLAFYNPLYQQYGILSAVILILLRWIEHRTLVHSVLAGLILSAPLYYLGYLQFLTGFIAFLAHIIFDKDFSLFAEKDWF